MRKIWTAVYLSVTVALAVLVFVLQEADKALGEVEVSGGVKTAVIAALVICAIILIAQVISRAGVKYTLPVTRYIITDGPAPDGVKRLIPDARSTGNFIMEMNVLSEQHMYGRQLNGDVEITIIKEPRLDYEAELALQSLRRDAGKFGVSVK